MHAVFRLFPWDVDGDPDAIPRLVDGGIERVSLAASYHGARVATPRHPAHRVMELPTSAVHARVPFGGLPPLPRGIGRYEDVRDRLEAAGIVVDTWLVVNHLDGAAREVPRIRSAFGDELGHAPCLAQAGTLAFDRSLLSLLLPLARGRQVLLEALGWQGLGHGSLHDKLEGAEFAEPARRALGYCVCERCLAVAGASDRDVAALRRFIDGERSAAGERAMERLRAGRTVSLAVVRDQALALASAAEVGSVLLDDADAGEGAAEVLVDCWGDALRGVEHLRSSRARHPDARLTAHVEVLSSDPSRLRDDWAALAEAGASGFHIYHAGLASDRRLAATRGALEG